MRQLCPRAVRSKQMVEEEDDTGRHCKLSPARELNPKAALSASTLAPQKLKLRRVVGFAESDGSEVVRYGDDAMANDSEIAILMKCSPCRRGSWEKSRLVC